MVTAEFLKDAGDTLGKQDPFLAFGYDGRQYKTEVKDDAGKSATYDDVFLLENIQEQALSGKELTMQAYDHDVGSSALLGEAVPISLTRMCSSLEPQTHRVDIFHEFKKSGFIVFESRFVFQEPDPAPNPKLNPFCLLEVTIIKAAFHKDADALGKQDPYIQFVYNGQKVRTDTKDNAGKRAEWNERFCLTQVDQQVQSGKRFILEAFDHDLDADDSLGKSKGISFGSLIQDEDEHEHDLKLYDAGSKETGEITIKTKFIVTPPEPEPNPDLNRNCILRLQIEELSTHKDADSLGKQDPVVKFKYNGTVMQTKVAQNAGKHATFNEQFELTNILEEIKAEEVLVIEAHDQDAVSSELLGRAMPISFSALTQSEELRNHELDLFDQNYKHIGSVKIVTHFIFQNVDPLPPQLNELSMLQISIQRVETLQDHDLFGKQDPFVTFLQGDVLLRTKAAENAGQSAEINEIFSLREIHRQLQADEDVTFQVFDQDVGDKADLLGQTRPFPYRKFCLSEKMQKFELDLFKEKKKCGKLIIDAKFIVGKVPQVELARHSAPTHPVSNPVSNPVQ